MSEVKIIRKQAEGVTDEMMHAVYTHCQTYPGGEYTPKTMRQAMESARKGEIERIEIWQDEDMDVIFPVDDDFLFQQDDQKILILRDSLRPLALALLELDAQLNPSQCGYEVSQKELEKQRSERRVPRYPEEPTEEECEKLARQIADCAQRTYAENSVFNDSIFYKSCFAILQQSPVCKRP